MPKLYVGNVRFDADEQAFRDFFQGFKLESVAICTDRETGRPRGFGFVEISDRREAERAISELDGTDFGGRTATVNEARDKPKPSRGGGAGKGKRGGGGRSRNSDWD